ncbi:hypothetical protein PAEPH01_1267 [Pancytospora epiphaga]|nr:hypothetical protein PAEPH01_1267 [Pancytospora epiphaga]
MEDNVELPVLLEARAYSSHRNYSAALEIYADILPTIDPQTIVYSHVLLEYAQCLIESVFYDTEVNYRKALQLKQKYDQNGSDEDLEIAWDCLETCRTAFEVVCDRERLCEVHKGLGDVHNLVNRFEEALKEYHASYEYCDDPDVSLELLECIAECNRNMGEYGEAADFYKQIAEQHKKDGDMELANEIESQIEGMFLMHGHETGRSSKKMEEPYTPKDINHLKKKK